MKRLPALLLLTFLASSLGAENEASYQVVIHDSNPVSSLGKDRLSRLFLKLETRWSDGTKVHPVDQIEARPVRHAFSREVHQRDVAWIKSYWHERIFSGRATPPPQVSTDSDVLDYVRTHPAAIGYVSAEASIGDGIKRLEVVD